MEIYQDVATQDFGYLVIDCTPGTKHEYQYRTHIFPNEDTVIYIKKQF